MTKRIKKQCCQRNKKNYSKEKGINYVKLGFNRLWKDKLLFTTIEDNNR